MAERITHATGSFDNCRRQDWGGAYRNTAKWRQKRRYAHYPGNSSPLFYLSGLGRRFGGLPVHADEAGGLLDASQPGPNRREGREVVVALIGDMGVAVERDIGDRELAGGEIVVGLEVIFHHLKRGIATFHPVFQRVGLQIAAAFDQRQPEIGRADIRLQRMLFEEHPLQGFGAFHTRVWRKRSAAGDVPEDGVGFGEVTTLGYFKQRNLAGWILRQKIRRATLAAQNIDLDRAIGCVEQSQRQADLVAIARALHGIEMIHYETVRSVMTGGRLFRSQLDQTMMPI